MTRRHIRINETHPKLIELLEKAAKHKMTKEEREAQRRSWVVGELMLEHPEMSRAEAEALYDVISP